MKTAPKFLTLTLMLSFVFCGELLPTYVEAQTLRWPHSITDSVTFDWDSSTVTLSGNANAPKCSGARRLIHEHVVVKDVVYTCGNSVEIIANILEFRPGAKIYTGYPIDAPGPKSVDPLCFVRACKGDIRPWTFRGTRQSGKPAGDITIIAKRINSINLDSRGQHGGNGHTYSCNFGVPFRQEQRGACGYGTDAGDSGDIVVGYFEASETLRLNSAKPPTINFESAEGGRAGDEGQAGQRGRVGTYSVNKFESEIEFYERALELIPELAEEIMRQAELKYLIDHADPKAKQLFDLVSNSNVDEDVKARARILSLRMDRGLTILNQSINFVHILTKSTDEGSRALTKAEIEDKVHDMQDDLAMWSQWVTELQDRAISGRKALLLAEDSKAAINQQIGIANNREAEFRSSVSRLNGRIQDTLTNIEAMKARILELRDRLRNLPQRILGNLTKIANGIGSAVQGAGEVISGIANFDVGKVLSGLGLFSSGVSDTELAFAKLRAETEKLTEDVRREIAGIQDRIFNLTTEVEKDRDLIAGAESRLRELEIEKRYYEKKLEFVESDWEYQNAESNIKMFHLAEKLFRIEKLKMGKELALYWAYTDYLRYSSPSLDLRNAPGGVDKTMGIAHFAQLKSTLRRQQEPRWRPLQISFLVKGSDNPDALKTLRTGKYALFNTIPSQCIAEEPILRNARMLSMNLDIEKEGGVAIPGIAEVVYHPVGPHRVVGQLVKYDVQPTVDTFISSGVSERIPDYTVENNPILGNWSYRIGRISTRNKFNSFSGTLTLKIPVGLPQFGQPPEDFKQLRDKFQNCVSKGGSGSNDTPGQDCVKRMGDCCIMSSGTVRCDRPAD